MQDLTDLIDKGAWLTAAALFIGLLARAAKEPWFFGGPFARVPRQHRWLVIAGLGLVSAVLEALVRGTSWPRAIAHGVLSAGAAMFGHAMLGGVSPERPAAPGESALSPEALALLKKFSAPPPVVPTTITIDGAPFVVPPFAATQPSDVTPLTVGDWAQGAEHAEGDER